MLPSSYPGAIRFSVLPQGHLNKVSGEAYLLFIINQLLDRYSASWGKLLLTVSNIILGLMLILDWLFDKYE